MISDILPTARRAVECPRWRVLAGMLMRHGEESIRVHGPDEGLVVPGSGAQRTAHLHLRYVGLPPRRGVWLPDLTDEATVGCLLGLVREVYPGCHAEPNGAPEWDGVDEEERVHWWAVYKPGGGRLSTGATEAEALVVALEGAA